MPFSKENEQRIIEIFGLILMKKTDIHSAERFTYRSVSHLKELDNIVKSELALEGHSDKETLFESFRIMWCLAYAYDALGRPAVSSKYYKKAIELAAILYETYGDEIPCSEEILYNTLISRNYYVDDNCMDIYKLALVFIPKDIVDNVFDEVMNNRRDCLHDPVEMTTGYLAVIDEIEEKIDKNKKGKIYRRLLYPGAGYCHYVWGLKASYLREKGIIWRDPSSLNPNIRFD